MIEGSQALKEDPQAFSCILDEDGNEHFADLGPYEPLKDAMEAIQGIDAHSTLDDLERLVRYQNVQKVYFGEHVTLPANIDDREYFEFVKRTVERRIADLAGDPNTISAVAERYYEANQIRPDVRRKYRGNIKKLTDYLDDIPISHVTSVSLRRFRDQQSAIMMPTSLASVFTPIRGMLRYATDEELIEMNPAQSVMLKKDKRSVHERKCIPYPPLEMKRISDLHPFSFSKLI